MGPSLVLRTHMWWLSINSKSSSRESNTSSLHRHYILRYHTHTPFSLPSTRSKPLLPASSFSVSFRDIFFQKTTAQTLQPGGGLLASPDHSTCRVGRLSLSPRGSLLLCGWFSIQQLFLFITKAAPAYSFQGVPECESLPLPVSPRQCVCMCVCVLSPMHKNWGGKMCSPACARAALSPVLIYLLQTS